MDPAESFASVSAPVSRPWSGRRQARLWAVGWAGWFITLCILSSMSQPGPRIDVVGIDKVYHAVYFAVGGVFFLLAMCWKKPGDGIAHARPSWGKLTVMCCLVGAIVGGIDEWHQSFTPGRHGLDVYDWLADIFGSLLAVPCARWIYQRLHREPE